MTNNSPLPQRKKLPHGIPAWVPDGSRYFITMNTKKRGADTLVGETTAKSLLDSIVVYEQKQKWWMYMFMVMPDHLHFIAAFGGVHGIEPVVTAWKKLSCPHAGH